jgi:UDP:flavonoid glycosyltransferase YjiC (YdhE family)
VELGTKLIFGKALNAKRRELGLPKAGRFSDYAAGYSHNLLAIDPVLVPPGRGWRHRYEYVGYPFGGDDGPLPAEVESFLAAGPPPVYFGFGSVCMSQPERITEMILGAVARVGCRAVLDQGWAKLGVGAKLPPEILLIRGVPHRRLFPRMAALVHHGGSGTTHNAARAGVPQAISPQILDQYYWGERIYHLGLGPRPLPVARFTAAKLDDFLRDLLGSTYANQARVVADLMRVDGVGAVADAIERVHAERAGASYRSRRRPVAVAGGAEAVVPA